MSDEEKFEIQIGETRELVRRMDRKIDLVERLLAGRPASTEIERSASGIEGIRAGEEREFGGIQMVWCPPGEFLMGSPEDEEGRLNNERQHRVTLTRGFWLAKTEATQGQWESVMGTSLARFGTFGKDLFVCGEGSTHPMYLVSWEDVQEWLAKNNELHPLPEGWEWDFPTEAQWEYACRATTTGAYGGTGNLDEMGWHRDNSGGKKHPAGAKQANAWGLYDMHGNVWEWCRDWIGNYPRGCAPDPTGPTSGSYRVARGGSWDAIARYCRAAARHGYAPGYWRSNVGFRPAAVPSAQ